MWNERSFFRVRGQCVSNNSFKSNNEEVACEKYLNSGEILLLYWQILAVIYARIVYKPFTTILIESHSSVGWPPTISPLYPK